MTATLEARKLHILKYLEEVQDEAVIHQIENLLFPTRDWWLDLSEGQQQSLKRGMEDARNGRVEPFEEVMAKLKSK